MTSGPQEPPSPPLFGPARQARAWTAGSLCLSLALLAVVAWMHARTHASGPDREFVAAIGLAFLLLAGAVWRTSRVARARDRYETALWEAEEQFRAFFEESPIGKSMTAPDGRLLRVNRALCSILGYPEGELTRLDFAAVTHPDDVAATREGMRALLAGEIASWSTEKRFVRKDGGVLWAGVTSSLRRDARGRPVCFMTHIQDISERKRTEAALRESEERFRKVLLLSPDAVAISRLDDGRYAWISPAFTRNLGFAPEEVLGRTAREMNFWESPAEREELVAGLGAQGRVENLEARFLCKDGAVRTALVSAAMVDLEGVRHLLASARDITDRKRLEEQGEAIRTERIRLLEETDLSRRALLSLVEDQARTEAALRQSEGRYRQLSEDLERRVRERTAALEVSNRELEAFSYSISHDLRAPLRAIEGFSAMAVERGGPQVDAELQRLLGIVRTNARRMARLIDDLLAFARTGRSEMSYGPVNMGGMARAAFADAAPDEALRAKIDFRAGTLPDVVGDAALLRQVWVNLLSNAVKFSSGVESPVVEVEGARKGDDVVYWVRDNGAGFDMKYVEKLFGVFQRLHGVKEFEGTGVGLALVQRIVGRHGGRVWAEGAVNKGATFSFSLPAGT